MKNIGIGVSDPNRMHLIVDTDKLVNYDDLHYFDQHQASASPAPAGEADPS